MKKILFIVLSLLIVSQSGYCTESATTTVLNDLKNAVVKDISDTVTTSVNNVKLATYKVQLEQKKKELEEVQQSSTFFIIKYFREISIRAKISDLEAKIREIEEAK